MYQAAKRGRLRTISDIRSAASIENARFRGKVIKKARQLALDAIQAGR